jgi:hypothetical protein
VPELVKAYVQQLLEGEEVRAEASPRPFVPDSALYSEENLEALSEVKFSPKVS